MPPPRTTAKAGRRVPAATPRDPRFRRARDGGAGATRSWRARAWLALRIGALVTVIGGSAWSVGTLMTTGDAFVVRHLHITGTARLSPGEIEALLGDPRGASIMLTPLDGWRQRLLASPWVRDASLRRALPDTVEVRVVERVPMAMARAGDVLMLIDEEGAVMDEFGPRYSTLDLPIIEGLLGDDSRTGGLPDPARVTLTTGALQSLRDAHLLARVSHIDVTHPRNAVVTLNDDPALLSLGDERFGERLQSYLDMEQRLLSMVQAVDAVDLRFGNRVYVRPQKAGVTFASMPPPPEADAVEEALADPSNDDAEE